MGQSRFELGETMDSAPAVESGSFGADGRPQCLVVKADGPVVRPSSDGLHARHRLRGRSSDPAIHGAAQETLDSVQGRRRVGQRHLALYPVELRRLAPPTGFEPATSSPQEMDSDRQSALIRDVRGDEVFGQWHGSIPLSYAPVIGPFGPIGAVGFEPTTAGLHVGPRPGRISRVSQEDQQPRPGEDSPRADVLSRPPASAAGFPTVGPLARSLRLGETRFARDLPVARRRNLRTVRGTPDRQSGRACQSPNEGEIGLTLRSSFYEKDGIRPGSWGRDAGGSRTHFNRVAAGRLAVWLQHHSQGMSSPGVEPGPRPSQGRVRSLTPRGRL